MSGILSEQSGYVDDMPVTRLHLLVMARKAQIHRFLQQDALHITGVRLMTPYARLALDDGIVCDGGFIQHVRNIVVAIQAEIRRRRLEVHPVAATVWVVTGDAFLDDDCMLVGLPDNAGFHRLMARRADGPLPV